MFDRKTLKERAKTAFKRNYWKCVIVSIILALLTGAAAGSATHSATNSDVVEINEQEYSVSDIDEMEPEQFMQLLINDERFASMDEEELAYTLIGAVAIIIAVVAVVAAIAGVIKIFVWNLFEVGGAKFFIENSASPASVGEIVSGFSTAYGRNALTMFLRDLYINLWTLLFVIPGIIKHYSYYLVPYILADSPDMSRKEAFALSRELMDGSKWKTFVLELSFIGWDLVSAITLGIAGVFYVSPYKRATFAELYLQLRYGDERVNSVI